MVGVMAVERLTPRQPFSVIAMSIVSQQIPVERLWELYSYNPFTGKFHKRTNTGKEIKGWSASDKRSWLIQIYYSGKSVQTNYGRAVFAWVTGAWPDPTVDHINRDPSDNRFQNLRESSFRDQNANRKNSGPYFSGQNRKNPWKAQIRINGKLKHLGYHQTKAEAQAAYARAASELP